MAGFQICVQQPSYLRKECRTGDPDLRPGRGHCTISWTPRMVENETMLERKGLLASVLGTQPHVSPQEMVEVVVNCGVLPSNFRVEVTTPEDYLIMFRNTRDRDWVLSRSKEVFCKEAAISFKRWDRRLQADSTKMQFFTKLSLEGLPQHAWEEEAVAQIVRELRGELVEMVTPADARVLTLFAWLSNPSMVPSVLEVEIPERAAGGPPRWERFLGRTSIPRAPLYKKSLTYALIVHIEEIINPTLLHYTSYMGSDDDDNGDVPRRVTFSCWAGRTDGTGPWSSEQGGGRSFGCASGAAGGLPGRVWSTTDRIAAKPAEAVRVDEVVVAGLAQGTGIDVGDGGLAAADTAASDIATRDPVQMRPGSLELTGGGGGIWFSPQLLPRTQADSRLGDESVPATCQTAGDAPEAALLLAAQSNMADDSWGLPTVVIPGGSPISLSMEEHEGGGVAVSQTSPAAPVTEGGHGVGVQPPADEANGEPTGMDPSVVSVDAVQGAPHEEPVMSGIGMQPASAPAGLCSHWSAALGAVAKKLQFEDLVKDTQENGAALMAVSAVLEDGEPESVGGNAERAMPLEELNPPCKESSASGPERALGPDADQGQNGPWPGGDSGPAELASRPLAGPQDLVQTGSPLEATSTGPLLVAGLPLVYGRRRDGPPQPAHADERLQDFLDSISATPPASVLGVRPPASVPTTSTRSNRCNVIPPDFTPWRSPRFQQQGSGAQRHTITKAKAVNMKKLGIIQEEEEATEDSVKKYLNLFEKPLSTQHVEALATLLDVDIAAQPLELTDCSEGVAAVASPA
ncbi:uncharacterized protein LOC127765934 [Oryza glaberrima]|uniref:uncharacterized protein LOC127765934 n=1 Tax=Oryza glaberrima TaxID=4538 RepID=UPI00224C1A6D|nr:uncharacterized protein LOC127765934 [Oryza glaberrima]